jgi:hypothetical protein
MVQLPTVVAASVRAQAGLAEQAVLSALRATVALVTGVVPVA